ncbi:MAG: RdgB/HAM1 family non-canonical purine NTP pyrophosphatase [Coriobacteriaceae bacterium]|jgi:XTP/dITP diphosphohydrolase|nr:RdgB/HAM1 family non-canonical purine NTP pyrophosphatase [Coriobacteriaceae bacterium]
MKSVVIASNNSHKVAEIKAALAFDGWEFHTLGDLGVSSDPVEDAETFEGNARIKAQAAHAATGLAALADDSGIVVDALGGAPGVLSARYAGVQGSDADNNTKLLNELEGVPDNLRTGRFVCALVFIDQDGTETSVQGVIEGTIGHAPQGKGGFGYDPLFFPSAYQGEKTLAEVDQDQKNAISHRGNALRALRDALARA